MMLRFLFLIFADLHGFAEAATAPTHLHSLLESARYPLRERSTGLYAAILGGNGRITDGWPRIDQWVDSFEAMFERNKKIISASCSRWGLPNNSEGETNSMKDAIDQVGKSSGIDARFILSIVMQESQGCVRVQTTNNGVINPGLMQSHEGSGSCNKDGIIQNPCPQSEVLQMIRDGVEGTSTGPGLKALIFHEGGTTDVTSFYKAPRAYNSGAVASSGNLGQGSATHCYASDIANRLLGWTDGPSLCAPDVIGVISAGFWNGESVAGESDHSAPSTTNARLLTQTQNSLSSPSFPSPRFIQGSVTRPPASLSSNQISLGCKGARSSLAT